MSTGERWIGLLASGVMPVIFGITALFCVRRFTVTQRELLIQRAFWQTRISLAGLRSAHADSKAIKRARRRAGNGGYFAYTGWFWSRRLGKFRAFVTDPVRSVVMEFDNHKLVVSPDKPDRFISALGFDPAAKRATD